MRYPLFCPNRAPSALWRRPSAPILKPYHTAFLAALEQFKREGFQGRSGLTALRAAASASAACPEKCGQELTDYYCSDRNDALISCGGGELMCEILDYVDFDRVNKAEPQVVHGLLGQPQTSFLLTTLCDTASIYGPCAGHLLECSPATPAVQDALDLLMGKNSP